MWRKLLRPDVLFTIASVQALSPYVFWQFGIGEFKGQANLTYIPVIVWVGGWAAFMLGTRFVKARPAERPRFLLASSERAITLATIVVILIVCVQFISLVRLYGGIPLLSYVRQDGAINIGTAVGLQEESGVGQVGSLYVTTAVLHGLLLMLIIRNLEKHRRDQMLIIIGFLVLLAAHGINGKREGFVRCAMFLITGLTMYCGDPIEALAKTTRLVKSRTAAAIILILTVCLLTASIGYLAYVRNQGHYTRGSFDELIAYQEFSLVNFEIQCADSGLGPHKLDPIMWLRRLVPWKLMDAVGVADADMVPRYEPWAPAGLYEDIKWSLGLPGALVFAFALGVVTMRCFVGALHSPFYLLAYSQITFALLIAHSFNLFIILSWIPAPVLLLWLLSTTLRRDVATTAGFLPDGVPLETAS